MNNPFSLEGKTILVTGASSGIGARCAIDCAAMGAKVVLIARNEQRLQETLSQMEGEGHGYMCYDLIKITEEGGKTLISSLVEKYGKFDGFLHCAGTEKTLPLKLIKPEDYEYVFKVNTLSSFEIIRDTRKCPWLRPNQTMS